MFKFQALNKNFAANFAARSTGLYFTEHRIDTKALLSQLPNI